MISLTAFRDSNLFIYIAKIATNKRLILPVLILVSLLFEPVRNITIPTLADAFFQVSVFVAGTLFVYYYLVDRLPQLELSYLRAKSPVLEIVFASILGALPGCGGAIIVVTQFTKKQASFSSVVAVLTATMGDAAFLLIAKDPLAALGVITLGVLVGIFSGLIVHALHKDSFCHPPNVVQTQHSCLQQNKAILVGSNLWKFLLAPCLIISFLIAFNVDLGVFESTVTYFGAAFALIAVLIWAFSSEGRTYKQIAAEDEDVSPPSKFARIIQDTHFVTAWVIASFMLYELLVSLMGLDLKLWFSEYAIYAPLIAVLIGLLPGCGPQILVTTLYIQGVIPFSALVGNAISNDGDALFPALAMAPKAAIIATLYSAIPALIISYLIFFL